MKLLEDIRDEVLGEGGGASEQAAASPTPAAAQAQSAELLGQVAAEPQTAASAQAAELSGAGDAVGVPAGLAEVVLSPEAEAELGPVREPEVALDAATIALAQRVVADAIAAAEARGLAAEEEAVAPVEPAAEREAALEAKRPALERQAGARDLGVRPGLTRQDAESDLLAGQAAGEQHSEQGEQQAAEQQGASASVRPGRRARLGAWWRGNRPHADELNDTLGPGVASSAQGPTDAIAHGMSAPQFDGTGTDAISDEFAGGFADGMGLAGTGASLVGGVARTVVGARGIKGGRAKRNAPGADASQVREGAAQERGGRAGVFSGVVTTTTTSVSTGTTIAGWAGRAGQAATVAGATGGGIGAAAGVVGVGLHARRGLKARHRYKALKGLKDYITDTELQAVRAYAAHKNNKARFVQGVQAAGGALNVGGGVAGVVAATAAGATLATPVGWGLAAGGAAVGLSAAGYFIGRKLYKNKVTEPRRAAAGLDPDQRRAMATKLREKLDDPLVGIRREAEAIVEALGVTLDEAKGAEGIELLKRKMRSN